jgi:hypothetical protein
VGSNTRRYAPEDDAVTRKKTSGTYRSTQIAVHAEGLVARARAVVERTRGEPAEEVESLLADALWVANEMRSWRRERPTDGARTVALRRLYDVECAVQRFEQDGDPL